MKLEFWELHFNGRALVAIVDRHLRAHLWLIHPGDIRGWHRDPDGQYIMAGYHRMALMNADELP